MRRFFVPSPVGRWGCARTLPPFYRRVAPPKIIPVACALILNRDGCVLLAQRPADKHLGLQWEFPGGKVEPGESPAAALIREIDEELGCRIEITGALPPFVHHYATVSIEMHPFVCRLAAATTAPPHTRARGRASPTCIYARKVLASATPTAAPPSPSRRTAKRTGPSAVPGCSASADDQR